MIELGCRIYHSRRGTKCKFVGVEMAFSLRGVACTVLYMWTVVWSVIG
jgi:hypothetical protein